MSATPHDEAAKTLQDLSDNDESKLVRGLKEAKSLVRNPEGWDRSLHREINLSKQASLYIETLQGEDETKDDMELLLFVDWDLLPNRMEAPMDVSEMDNGVPEVVSRVKEVVEQEVGYPEKYINFELTNNLATQAVYRAFVVDQGA